MARDEDDHGGIGEGWPPSRAEFSDPDLEFLVAEALEASDSGEEVDLTRICRRRPDLLPALRDALGTGSRLRGLQRAVPAEDRHAGQTLSGRYRLEERVGAGAMGVVHRAMDIELRREVAVKILRADLVEPGAAERRFEREAEVLATLEHPSIVRVLDRGRTDTDDLYLVMEFVDGVTLQDLIDRRRRLAFGGEGATWLRPVLGPDAELGETSFLRLAVSWTADLAAALAVAHRRHVYHRDVKPSNVIVRRSGAALLVDFGIATAAGGADSTLTIEGRPLGTPAYVAPEALEAVHVPGPATDVYGLAATLYALLAGRAPFEGSPSQVLARLAHEDPTPLHRIARRLPRDIVGVIEKGMARDPRRRYGSAAELESDLRAFLDHRAVTARPSSAFGRVLRRVLRSRVARGAAAAVAVVSLAGGVVHGLGVAAEQRIERAFDEGMRRIPPKLGFASLPNRATTGRAEFEATMSALDAARAVERYGLAAGAQRAALLLDHGRAMEAADQLRALASTYPSAYSEALAAAYAELPEGASSALDVDRTGLPEPATPEGRYLALFQAMRALEVGTAAQIAATVGDDDLPEARTIAALFRLSDPRRAEDFIRGIERDLGGRTASTADLLGICAILQGDHPRALELYHEALALAPHSYVLHENLVVPAWRTGQVDEALRACDAVIGMRPFGELARKNAVLIHLDQGDLVEARRAIEAIPTGLLADGESLVALLEGELLTERALARLRAGDRSDARELAADARGRFAAASALGRDLSSVPRTGVADALAADDDAAAVDALLSWAADAPLEASRLASVRSVLSELRTDALPGRGVEALLEELHGALRQRALVDQQRLRRRADAVRRESRLAPESER